ncbi:MAG: hypothetical protein R3C52_09100 [Hyphomonadaceae bacterium]
MSDMLMRGGWRCVRGLLVACALVSNAIADSNSITISSWEEELSDVASLERLNADLLASASATLTLEAWCMSHKMASPAIITVERDTTTRHSIDAEQRHRLGIGPDVPIEYRNVKLKCGNHVLSEAENWYVPSRLSPEMNAELTETNIPYGKVIHSLRPFRRTFLMKRDWDVLGQEGECRETRCVAKSWPCDETAFTHHALVISGENIPLAEVRENYKLELICETRSGYNE